MDENKTIWLAPGVYRSPEYLHRVKVAGAARIDPDILFKLTNSEFEAWIEGFRYPAEVLNPVSEEQAIANALASLANGDAEF